METSSRFVHLSFYGMDWRDIVFSSEIFFHYEDAMNDEHPEISLHQIKVYRYVADTGTWLSNRDIAAATGVAPRTVRQHTLRLVHLGIFDQADVFPGHQYRYSEQAPQRNKAYLLRLQEADRVLGGGVLCVEKKEL